MKKKTFLILPLAALSLAACAPTVVASTETSSSPNSSSSHDAYAVKWVSPVGAPAIAFYDQGSNSNWVSSSNPQGVVVPALGTNTYDAVIFDGISGLNVIKKNSWNYKLAQWVSGGNFYLVSIKHSVDEYQSGMTVDSFVKTGNASQAFLNLAKTKWKWTLDSSSDYPSGSVKWENGVSAVLQNLESNDAFDYYVIAEPILTAAKTALAANGKTLNVIYNLQTEWAEEYHQPTIPAGAIFVNTQSWGNHKEALSSWLTATQTRQDICVTNPDTVKKALDDYGDDNAVKTRFGFTSSLASALQQNGNDKFGILKTGAIADNAAFANDFAKILAGATAAPYSSDLFLTR